MVHSQTKRYNTKIRAGRGFTLDELKAAEIPVKYAPTIGIAVDHRRKNRSEESLQENVKRLLAYKERLVLFPRRRAAKAGEKAKTTQKTALPITKAAPVIESVAVTAEMKAAKAYATLRLERMNMRMVGIRKKRAEAQEKEAQEKAKA
jgi:large subunit ribosomal protein L13e